MSGIQRWTSWCSDPKREDDNGDWVRYEDHLAALADVYTLLGEAVESGIRQAREDAARDVAALEPLYDPFPVFPRGPIAYLSDAVAAARGGTDE